MKTGTSKFLVINDFTRKERIGKGKYLMLKYSKGEEISGNKYSESILEEIANGNLTTIES